MAPFHEQDAFFQTVDALMDAIQRMAAVVLVHQLEADRIELADFLAYILHFGFQGLEDVDEGTQIQGHDR